MVCPTLGVAAISELTVAITEVTHRARVIGPPRVLDGDRIVSGMRRPGYWTMVWIDAWSLMRFLRFVIAVSCSRRTFRRAFAYTPTRSRLKIDHARLRELSD